MKGFTKYYSKLMYVNMLVIIMGVFIYASIAFIVASQSENREFLKKYDERLLELVSYYNAKNEQLYYIMLPFYNDSNTINDLQKFFVKSENELTRDITWNKNFMATLKNTCERDRDIQAFFLYKKLDDSLYIYNPQRATLNKLIASSSFLKEISQKSNARELLGSQLVDLQPSLNQKDEKYVYGIASTFLCIGLQDNDLSTSFMVAYDTTAINSVLQLTNLDPNVRFMLVTFDEQIVFDSFGQYNTVGSTKFDLLEALSAGDIMTIDGKKYFKSVYVDDIRRFAAVYYLPQSIMTANSIRISIPIILSLMVFVCLTLSTYTISSKASIKHTRKLEYGMKEIGANNLNYRIPVAEQNDEFSMITQKFNQMCDDLQESINKEYIYQLKQKSAEFYAMQTSINPHFLFNTLEAIRGFLSNNGNTDASEMIIMLSRLFEYQFRGNSFVTFGEELDKLKIYIDFLGLRYDYRFIYTQEIDKNIYRYGIPKLIFQPIVENYFIHGMKKGTDNKISITGILKDNIIEINIQDNGNGIEPELLSNLKARLLSENSDRTSIGLQNVHERLRLTFGGNYGVSVESEFGRGTKIILKIKAMYVEELADQLIIYN